MSKSTLKTLPALLVAITAAFVTQSVCGQVTPVITFTEHSSTNLTAVYTDGSGGTTNLTVNLIAGFTDAWNVDLTGTNLQTLGRTSATWVEPNTVDFQNSVIPNVSFFDVFSDAVGTGQFANNTITINPIAVDGSGSAPVGVFGIFNDLGDTAAVPDTGTTASLLGLSLAGLAFLRRKLS
jgi:VPDSG-CTERM motif